MGARSGKWHVITRPAPPVVRTRFAAERANILQHTRRLIHFSELEQLQDYPDAVKRLLTRIQRFKAHILLKQIL